jgi:hypothetical protein
MMGSATDPVPAIGAEDNCKLAPSRRLFEHSKTELTVDQCFERDIFCRAGNARNQSMKIIVNGAGDEFRQRAQLTMIGSIEGSQIPRALGLKDNCWWPTQTNQNEVQQQAAGATVSVEEAVDTFEFDVRFSQEPWYLLNRNRTGVDPLNDCE